MAPILVAGLASPDDPLLDRVVDRVVSFFLRGDFTVLEAKAGLCSALGAWWLWRSRDAFASYPAHQEMAALASVDVWLALFVALAVGAFAAFLASLLWPRSSAYFRLASIAAHAVTFSVILYLVEIAAPASMAPMFIIPAILGAAVSACQITAGIVRDIARRPRPG